MSNKSNAYWISVHGIATEIQTLSLEVQGPLIQEHIPSNRLHELDPTEVTTIIEQYYTDEDRERWHAVELRTIDAMKRFNVSREDIGHDLWKTLSSLPPIKTMN